MYTVKGERGRAAPQQQHFTYRSTASIYHHTLATNHFKEAVLDNRAAPLCHR